MTEPTWYDFRNQVHGVATALEREGPGPRRHGELYSHGAQALSFSVSPRRVVSPHHPQSDVT